jgi:hypothetical protein
MENFPVKPAEDRALRRFRGQAAGIVRGRSTMMRRALEVGRENSGTFQQRDLSFVPPMVHPMLRLPRAAAVLRSSVLPNILSR